MKTKKLKWHIDAYTSYLLKLKMRNDPSFKRCFNVKYDLTQLFHQKLHDKIHGKIKSHFVLFIKGLNQVDTGTGCGKTSLAQEIFMQYDSKPTIDKIGFSNDEILDKIKNTNHTTHTIYIRDETPESLKYRSNVEFSTLIAAVRQKQISFILVKPTIENLHSATFVLEPICFTHTLRHLKSALYIPDVGYIGYIITKIHLNNPLWNAYQPYKNAYIQTVLERQTGKFEHQKFAEDFTKKNPNYAKCITNTNKINKIRLRKYIAEAYPNLTHEERKQIADTIQENHELQ